MTVTDPWQRKRCRLTRLSGRPSAAMPPVGIEEPRCRSDCSSPRAPSVELTFSTVRTIQISTELASLGEIKIEQVGNSRLIAGLSLGVVQRCHTVTFRIGRWSIQGYVAGSVGLVAAARHGAVRAGDIQKDGVLSRRAASEYSRVKQHR